MINNFLDESTINLPDKYEDIVVDTKKAGFDQISDLLAGSMLATLSATKQNGHFLELGTGSGISTSWILQGMDKNSSLTSIDCDSEVVSIARQHLANDPRVNFIVGEGEDLILNTATKSVDFIFADAWAGKYNHVEETLALLKKGGIYIVDDMLPRSSWLDGHEDKANRLVKYLESRIDFIVTKMS